MDPSTILKKNLPLLMQQLQPDEVLDHLLSVDVLSEVEYDRCRDSTVKSDRTRELVRLLMYKREHGYREFCKILDRDQRHVKQALDNTARGEGSHDLVYIPETTLTRELQAREETISLLQKEQQRIQHAFGAIGDNERKKIARELHEEKKWKIQDAAQMDLEAQRRRNNILEEQISKLAKENKDLQSTSLALPRTNFEQEEQKQPSLFGPVDPMKCALVTSKSCDPKQGLVLPCLHSVCEACLQQHAEESLVCFCGREVACNEITQVDYVRRHEYTRDTNIRCGFRRECTGAVVSTCRECNIYLCSNCTLLHKDINSSASHCVGYLNRSPEKENPEHCKRPMCDNHSNQRVICIDHQCRKKICGTCSSTIHAGHDVSSIEDEYDEQKSDLETVIEEHNRELQKIQGYRKERHDRINALKTKMNAEVQRMTNYYEEFVQTLKGRFSGLIETMIREGKRLQYDIDQDVKSLQETEAAFRMTVDYAQRCMNVDQLHLISLAPMIARNAEEDRKRLLPKCRALPKEIVYCSQGHAALHSLICRVGDIKYTADPDNLPKLEDLQQQIDALKQKLASLTDEHEKKEAKNKEEKVLSCEAVSLLKDKLEQCGIFIHKPEQLRRTSVLQCIHLEFSKDKVNSHKARITTNGDLVNDGKILTLLQGQGRLQRYMGTCGTTILPSPGVPGYLEMIAKVCLKSILTKNDLILEIGMCREQFKDKGHTIGNVPHSYIMAVSHCTNHNRICLIFWKEKRHLLCLPTEDLLNNAVASVGTLRVGIAYDHTRESIAFIDVEARQVMTVIHGVDFRSPLWPMFGVYNPERVSVSMSCVKVSEMEISEEKIRLILNALT